MKQQIIFSEEAREKILEGVNLTVKSVSYTLGPAGKNCLIHNIFGGVRSTKDGISVINEIRPDDPLVNAGVKLLRQASQKTADEAGDSTTTTAILSGYMINAAHELLKDGHTAVSLRKGIEKATAECVKWIKENAIPVNGSAEKIKHIANIASNNNEEIGNLIAEAYSKLGDTGEITLEESKTDHSEIDILGGYSFNRGMVSPYFITNPIKGICELEEPIILLYDKKISKVVDILPVLDYTIKNQRSLLIIAAGCENQALGTLIQNKVHHGLKVCVVAAPEGGIKRAQVMQDIGIFTGGSVINEDEGTSLDKFKPELLGVAQKIIAKRDSCVIVNGQGNPDKIEERQKEIKEMILEAPSDLEKEYLRKRAGSIGRGVAVLYIGAATEIERGDKKDLAEDAILAVRSAIEEGYLPGGGVGLIRCSQGIESDGSEGFNIVKSSLFKPLYQLLDNNGVSSFIHGQVQEGKGDYGYNAKTDTFGNLIEEGVIDAAKVIRCAIENAASVTSMFLSTEVLISEIE